MTDMMAIYRNSIEKVEVTLSLSKCCSLSVHTFFIQELGFDRACPEQGRRAHPDFFCLIDYQYFTMDSHR